jgi:Ca2+-binding EF-hand superfamily protein
MRHSLALATLLALFSLLGKDGQAADKAEPKKGPQALAELVKGSPDDFIKHFDKNNDGFLTKDELPPFLAALFEKSDLNRDGKLDRKEVEAMLQVLRTRLGDAKGRPARPDVEKVVDQILAQMDTNKDGKISKAEAKGQIAENFDRLDTNKDGFLDRVELRQMAMRFLENQGRGGPGGRPSGPDFDALDRDADGRLTREELKGTPYYDKFDEIDTNKDGQIDRKEFTAWLKKQAEKNGN